MNVCEKTLLQLISYSQFGVGDNCFDYDLLDDVLSVAKVQSVLGLVISSIPTDLMTDDVKILQDRQTANYIRYLYEEDQLKKLLNDNHIPFVILKGNAAAINYRTPSLRMMGDVDFIVLVVDRGGFGQDGDAAFPFDGVAIHHAVLDRFVVAEGARLGQKLVDERGFAMVNVSDDRNVFRLHIVSS